MANQSSSIVYSQRPDTTIIGIRLLFAGRVDVYAGFQEAQSLVVQAGELQIADQGCCRTLVTTLMFGLTQ